MDRHTDRGRAGRDAGGPIPRPIPRRTPKGRLTRLEKDLLAKPLAAGPAGVRVKLLPRDGQLYVFFATAPTASAKERACGDDS